MPTLSFNYQQIEPQVRHALYQAFGQHLAIGTEEIDGGRVFLKVIGEVFNGLSEKEKQERVWGVLQKLGTEGQAVSLVLAFGTDEI